MSQTSLIPSIKCRDDFSVGRFSNACTMPWSLSPPIEHDWSDADEMSLDYECPEGNVHWFHGVRLIGPNIENREDEAGLAWRFLCHLLIDHISDEGIPDVCESLREFYDYYKPAEASRRCLPEMRERMAIRGAQTVRPSFAIEGE